MRITDLHAPFLRRQALLASVLAMYCLSCGVSLTLAASVIPFERFKALNDPAVTASKETIGYYGLRIKETREDLLVSYQGRQIKDLPVTKLFGKGLNIRAAYVVDDYPRQGHRTLFVPTFSGGANCCVVDLIVTKSDDALVVSTVDSGSGHGIMADDIKNNEPLVVSSICALEADLHELDPDGVGWCTATAPRPDTCLVFEEDAWRFAKPGEKPALYEKLLQRELVAATDPSPRQGSGEPLDKESMYANATSLLFYAIMAGKSQAEADALLQRVVPGLDARRRRIFIANVEATILGCRAIESRRFDANASQASLSAAPGSVSSGKAAAGERFAPMPCGAIADAANGLEWFVGPDVDTTFTQAKAWARSLDACGKEWELPTIAQLATLYDPRSTAGTGFETAGKRWPAHLDPVFSGIGGGSWVWSREELDAGMAKSYNFNQGTETRTGKPGKGMTLRAFAVRKRSSRQ